MSDKCTNCGAGLIPGARFCRFCGERTGELISEELPTRLMPSEDPRRFGALYTGAPQPPAVVATYAQPSHKPWAWFLVLAVMVIIGFVSLGVVFLTRSSRRSRRNFPTAPPPPSVESVSPIGGSAFNEEGASVSAKETVYRQRFHIGPDETFAITNFSGNIRIEASDEPDVEVKLTKRGASPQLRRAIQVSSVHKGGELTLSTSSNRGDINVDYEVKLPRDLKRLRIESLNSSIKVEGMNTDLVISLQNGSVELDGFSGSARTTVTAGETKVALKDVSATGELVFSSLAGNIEVKLDEDLELNVDAEAKVGQVSIDEGLGISLTRNFLGQSAKGRIGAGGRPLIVKTVTGSITIER